MQKLMILCLLVGLVGFTGCSKYDSARLGDKLDIDVPKGQKLCDVAISRNTIWYGHRAMREGEAPEVVTYNNTFSEGTITFTESR